MCSSAGNGSYSEDGQTAAYASNVAIKKADGTVANPHAAARARGQQHTSVAGAFGFESHHFDVSKAIGERVLLRPRSARRRPTRPS